MKKYLPTGPLFPPPLSGLLLVATWILHLPAATIFTLMLLVHGAIFASGSAHSLSALIIATAWVRFNLGNYLLSLCNTSVHTYKLRAAFSCILTHIALSSSAVNRDCCESQKIRAGNPNRLLESDAHLRESIYRCIFASLSPLFTIRISPPLSDSSLLACETMHTCTRSRRNA